MKTCSQAFVRLCVAAIILSVAPLARGSCNLQITSAGPCLPDGTPGTPAVGQTYGLIAVVNVTGTPSQPFRIRWTLADITNYFTGITVGPGDGYTWQFEWYMDLDDPIPWSVTLDPDGVSGNTNIAGATASGTFTPTPPATPVNLYSPRVMHGTESYSLELEPDDGTIPNLYVLFGCPTSHGAQNVISVTGPPAAGAAIVTQPYGVPVFQIARTNVPAGTYQDTNAFTIQLNCFRVNPTILRTNTWADMAALPTNWTQWLAPDARNESTNPLVINFVQESLPSNYMTTMTPYDTARALHKAVMARLTYEEPPESNYVDAVGVLETGYADCGGFSALLTSSLRYVGIPARCISGFREGDSQWHVRVEFHLPGVEWIVADPTDGNSVDPTGSYAFDFGAVSDANSFFAVDVGDVHIFPYNTFEFIQVPNLWISGGANYYYDDFSYLQPNGVLTLTNSPAGLVNFYLNDPPTEGSVILQSSTDLNTWSPVQTNSSDGSILNYSFSSTSGSRKFYRAIVTP